MCGEKQAVPPARRHLSGSPPRVRGKVHAGNFVAADLGITPACAGKSKSAPTMFSTHQDHPRVCGEKPAGVYQGAASLGSPPRVRGKVTHGWGRGTQ